jgi:hypothetical protein
MERATLTVSPTHSEDWRMEIITFLRGNHPVDDEAYTKRMQARTRPYKVIERELYKEGVCSPLLKCISRDEGQKLIREIHSGLCDSHIGSKALLEKTVKDFTGQRQLQIHHSSKIWAPHSCPSSG